MVTVARSEKEWILVYCGLLDYSSSWIIVFLCCSFCISWTKCVLVTEHVSMCEENTSSALLLAVCDMNQRV